MTNGKSYVHFQLMPESTTLDGLVSKHLCHVFLCIYF